MYFFSKQILEQNNLWLNSVQLTRGRTRVNLSEQLIEGVASALQSGIVKKGDVLPSINQLSSYFNVSRWTVEKAFEKLKKEGYIDSVPGKGYFALEVPKGAFIPGVAADVQCLVKKISILPYSKLKMVQEYLENISNDAQAIQS